MLTSPSSPNPRFFSAVFNAYLSPPADKRRRHTRLIKLTWTAGAKTPGVLHDLLSAPKPFGQGFHTPPSSDGKITRTDRSVGRNKAQNFSSIFSLSLRRMTSHNLVFKQDPMSKRERRFEKSFADVFILSLWDADVSTLHNYKLHNLRGLVLWFLLNLNVCVRISWF